MSDQPSEKPTVEIAAPPPWAVEMAKNVQCIRTEVAAVDTKVDRLEMNLELQGGQIGVVQGEVRSLFEWKGAVEQRLNTNSQRAAAPSNIELKHEAALAEVIVKNQERDRQIAETRVLADKAATKEDMKALADGTATKAEVEAMLTPTAEKVDKLTATQDVQLAILARLDKVASNPTVKVIAGMIATALLTWLFSHGGSLK